MTPDYTVVVGVDAKTLPYLECNAHTWFLMHPQLAERPWVVFHDISVANALDAVRRAVRAPSVEFVEWHGSQAGYPSQREKMVSGHVYVSRRIRTEWFVKIDCDSIALEPVNWPKSEWFEDHKDGREPVLVGPSWGYTRAKAGGGNLWEWCEIMEQFGDKHFRTPRAAWVDRIGDLDHPKGPKMKQKRWVSWLGWQRSEWVREMADLFERECGPGRLPLPSHDSSLWMAAERSGAYYVCGRDQKAGWTNRVTLSSCRKQVAEVLEQHSTMSSQ